MSIYLYLGLVDVGGVRLRQCEWWWRGIGRWFIYAMCMYVCVLLCRVLRHLRTAA